MPQAAAVPVHRFAVRLRADPRRSRIVEDVSFEAAAIAYIEDGHPAVDDDHVVSLIVRDLEDGCERCFRVDLDSGDTAPCD